MEKHLIETNGEKIYFYIQRKDIKNMNLRVSKDKKVTISIPKKMPLEKAEEFINKKVNWIKKQLEFYDTYAKKKEKITFENENIVYLLGKQYEIILIKDVQNNIEFNNKYIELHIKEKYIENKKYIKKVYDEWLKNYAFNILEKLVEKYQKE